MTAQWRAVGHDDVPAWAGLLAAAEQVDRTGEHYDEDDLHEELADPATGPDDRLAAWLGDRMVAYAGVRPRATPAPYWRIDAEGVVHPGHRGHGLGQHGLQWIVDRSKALATERHPGVETRVHVNGHLANTQQVALLEREGFAAVNWSATMRVQLAAAVAHLAPPSWPDGYRLRAYAPDWSGRVLAAHNAAFTDHWGFVPWTESMWKQWHDGSRSFRPALSWVVTATGAHDVAGYLVTSEFDAYRQVTGRREAYLAKLGVRREHRGRGLASALLRHALHAYAAQGYDESSLDVDTDNPTGAFGLYERVGFQIETRTATFERLLSAVTTPAGRPG
jgi:mycothiol synthase